MVMLGHFILDLLSIQLMFITLYILTPATLLALLTFMLRLRGPVDHKNFDDLEIKQSSTWRELKSVSFALRSFSPVLHDSSVKL